MAEINEDIFDLFVDLDLYAVLNPDLAAAGVDSDEELEDHLENFGVAEGRRFSRYFDLNYYRSSNTDLAGFDNEQLLEHFQDFGIDENRSYSAFIDLTYYRRSNADLANFTNEQLVEHFQDFGIDESRRFSTFIDLNYYRASNVDLANLTNEELLEHLETNGIREGRRFSRFVDISYYLEKNPDVNQAFGGDRLRAFEHMQAIGIREGRELARFLDLGAYLASNQDLRQAFGNDRELALEHLQQVGINENRPGVSQSFSAQTAQLQTLNQLYEALGTDFNEFLDILTDNVVVTFSGRSGGVVPFAGTFIGREGAAAAFQTLAAATTSDVFTIEETLGINYRVDLTQANPLIATNDRVAAILEEDRTVISTGIPYRIDVVNLVTVQDSRISSFDAFFDSYVPSEAFSNDPNRVANPDIDPLLGTRNPNANPQDTLNAVLNFFGAFGQVNASGNFDVIRPTLTDDVVIGFAGDPEFLPFAGIQQGKDGVVNAFETQLSESLPRLFDINEIFVQGDRAIANTFEARTSTESNRGYEVDVQILLTARNGLISSIQGVYDSVITTTAFTGTDPFPVI